jgi:hypothetical protein
VRKLLFVVLMVVGCTGPQRTKSEVILDPSKECHMLLDTLCYYSAVCGENHSGTEEEVLKQCLAFVDGKILFNGNPINARDQCDQVNYFDSDTPNCILALADSQDCSWPPECDSIKIGVQ